MIMITPDNTKILHQIKPFPRYLWFLMLSYAVIMLMANWFDPRLINIFGFTTDAGTLIFPLTFLLSDLITEVYGYKHARRTIWAGFLFNCLFLVYGQIVIHMPNPPYPTSNVEFDRLLDMDARIIIASMISYLIAEPINSYLMAKLKSMMKGRHMAIRFIASTFAASGVDSFIFGTIAFYGVMSNVNLFNLIVTMWFIKIIIELCGLPVSIRLAKKLKAVEMLDIYDGRTNFNLFSLDVAYTAQDNKFVGVSD